MLQRGREGLGTLRTFLIATLALTLLGSSVASADTTTVTANIHQIDKSGIKAELTFVDDGASLNATGTGTGFELNKFYLSLVYEAGSKPAGPQACESPYPPDDPRYLADFNQRFLGFWFFGPSTTKFFITGSFVATDNGAQFVPGPKTGGNYVPLSRLGTVSIREVTFVTDPVLRACGAIGDGEA
jgi:hypothetical protein